MIQYPTNIPVQTDLGEVFITATSHDHVYVDGSANGRHIVVNGVDVTASLHLNLVDGTWVVSHQYTSRRGSFKDVSDAGKKKIKDVLLAAVVAYIKLNPHLLVDARGAAVLNKRESLLEELAKKKKEVAALEEQICQINEFIHGEEPFAA